MPTYCCFLYSSQIEPYVICVTQINSENQPSFRRVTAWTRLTIFYVLLADTCSSVIHMKLHQPILRMWIHSFMIFQWPSVGECVYDKSVLARMILHPFIQSILKSSVQNIQLYTCLFKMNGIIKHPVCKCLCQIICLSTNKT